MKYNKNVLDEELIAEMEERRLEGLMDEGIDEGNIIDLAVKNRGLWTNFFNENDTRGKQDQEFLIRDQWTAIEKGEFTRLFKPALVFNKLYDSVKKVSAEQRKNKPDLEVRSLDGLASQDEVTLRENLVRTISYHSQNDLIYQTAYDSALTRGWGAFQVATDYANSNSFDLIIKYICINDPTRVFFDPKALLPHKGDGNYCGKTFDMYIDEFEATYPYIKNPVSFSDSRTLLDFQWETKDTITICDFFQKEWFSKIIYLLDDGRSVTEDEWEDMKAEIKNARKMIEEEGSEIEELILKELPKIVRERQSEDYRIVHYRLLQNCIIDFSIWPSKHLPIIYVDGDSRWIDGLQYTRSFIYDAKDAQRFLNYVGSEIAAEIKNRRREQWLVTPDNIKGQEQQWRNPELQQGALVANPDLKTGMMPMKQNPSEVPQSLLMQYQRATMDIHEILGFSEANLGFQSNEQSGVAIDSRSRQGSLSAFVFKDNLDIAIAQSGRVVLDLLPVVYDTERDVVLSTADGKTRNVTLNKTRPDGSVLNGFSKGNFDIEIKSGPSFMVQKSESLTFFLKMATAFPQTFPLVADLIARNVDLEYSQQLYERLQTLVPPEILAKEEGKEPPPEQPNMQVMLAMQAMKEKEHELQIREKKYKLEEIEMALKARELMAKLENDKENRETEKSKTDMEFTKSMMSVVKDFMVDARKDL